MTLASPKSVRELIADFAVRPPVFSRYTTPRFWNDTHISRQMLEWHLREDTDRASYRPERVSGAVEWLGRLLGLEGRRVCDLGCGPGLYAERMHDDGARVTGIDVSSNSLVHAKENAERSGRRIDYLQLDYTAAPLPDSQDVFTMISQDFGVLSPDQRSALLAAVRRSLNDGGTFVFDIAGDAAFALFEEGVQIEDDLMEGFWAPGPYVGLQRSYAYEHERVSLERYLILAETESFEVFNWMQYFSVAMIRRELLEAGFDQIRLFGDLNGGACQPEPMAMVIVAR
jgi:SAM-dependent methyltransferase